MGANELSALLWRERELLELLIFKLDEEQLLLANGKTRWLQQATREVEQVLGHVREAGLARSVEVSALAAEWGTAEDATLRELVAHAPVGPWTEIMASHFAALGELTIQIKELRDANEQLLRAAVRSSQETLADVRTNTNTYDSRGTSDVRTAASRLFDQIL
ncbi:flagellar protein FlgN [Cryobacterium fucosi]|uniref:Flagellar protein FlgN n=1 Tax=Cryobacterium fucosi TaxID=1259157 RepID=A0A4R9B360_9MICO|nr:flagellar protein FlgN [Cryobacterium fucosi]TFD73981.1 flagellar protein FlgN [Cryobacterium fucosi]